MYTPYNTFYHTSFKIRIEQRIFHVPFCPVFIWLQRRCVNAISNDHLSTKQFQRPMQRYDRSVLEAENTSVRKGQ